MNIIKLGLALAAATFVGATEQAAATPYTADATTGTYSIGGDPYATDLTGGVIVNLGWDGSTGSPNNLGEFDQLSILPVTGNITSDGTYLLNTFDFNVGLNRAAAAGPFSYSFSEHLVIGAVDHLITIPFTVSISSSDTLIFASSDPMYDLGIFTLNIESLPTGPFVNGGGHMTGQIYAKVTGVPEPGTLALMAAGLLAIFGFGLMRRRADT